MTGLQQSAPQLWTFLANLVLLTNCASALGFCIGTVAPTPQLAIVTVPLFFIPFLLVGGLIANKDRLDPYFTWLESISFFSFGYEGCVINEFSNLDFRFNVTLLTAVPTIEMRPTAITLPSGASHTVQLPTVAGHALESQSREVHRSGADVVARAGFDGSIRRSFMVLALWYSCAFTVAFIMLWLRANGGPCIRKLKARRGRRLPVAVSRGTRTASKADGSMAGGEAVASTESC